MIKFADFLPEAARPAEWEGQSADIDFERRSFETVANSYSAEVALLEASSIYHHKGADDFTGTLHARDIVESALSSVPAEYRDAVNAWLSKVDEIFLDLTQNDAHCLISKLNPNEPTPPEWWWHRIPLSGPILDELQEYRFL